MSLLHCYGRTATDVRKDGRERLAQRYRCRGCQRTFTDRTSTLFARLQWPQEVVTTAVRWSFCFRLSAANVRDLLAERGIHVSARTVLRWAHTFGPLLAAEWRRQVARVGRRWWCDETYVRVHGRWAYLYRAIDEDGHIVDVLLREWRDVASAEAFFAQATGRCGRTPEVLITDKHQAYVRAIQQHAPGGHHIRTGLHRARGETTKPVERSHVTIKDRLRPMRGLLSVATGQRFLEGIEAAQDIRRVEAVTADSRSPQMRARAVVQRFEVLAHALRR